MLKCLIFCVWKIKKKKFIILLHFPYFSLAFQRQLGLFISVVLGCWVKIAQSICPPHIRDLFVTNLHSLLQSYPLFLTQLKSLS